ncbi:MAG: DUF4912 domain-containing protein [bacterium]
MNNIFKNSIKTFNKGIGYFPTQYDQRALYLLEIDPYHLYACWTAGSEIAEGKKDQQLCVRVYEDTHQSGSFFDLNVPPGTTHCYIELGQPIKECRVALGVTEGHTPFTPLLESQVNYNPGAGREKIEDQVIWMNVNESTGKSTIVGSEYGDDEIRVPHERYAKTEEDSRVQRNIHKDKEIIEHYQKLGQHVSKNSAHRGTRVVVPSSLVPDVSELFPESAEHNYSRRLLDKEFFSHLDASESHFAYLEYIEKMERNKRATLFQGVGNWKGYYSGPFSRTTTQSKYGYTQ